MIPDEKKCWAGIIAKDITAASTKRKRIVADCTGVKEKARAIHEAE